MRPQPVQSRSPCGWWQVPHRERLHETLLEAVENHCPEARAARRCALPYMRRNAPHYVSMRRTGPERAVIRINAP